MKTFNDRQALVDHKKLVKSIPSEDDFNLMERVIPIWTDFEELTLFFESEKLPNIAWCVAKLTWLHLSLFSLKVDAQTRLDAEGDDEALIVRFIEIVIEEMEKETRFKDFGALDPMLAWGNILHPYFRGLSLTTHRSKMTKGLH